MSRPSVAELRPVVHPQGVKDRRSGEHWAGALYMRETVDLRHLVLAKTPITPNQLTYLMTSPGSWPAPVLLLPGLVGRGRRGAAGPALPAARLRRRRARPLEEAELAHRRLPRPGRRLLLRGRPAGRAGLAGVGRSCPTGRPCSGFAAALGAILIKAETDLVGVARAQGGLPPQGGVGRASGRAAAGAGPQGRRGAEVPPARPGGRAVHPRRDRGALGPCQRRPGWPRGCSWWPAW